jgi:perosamine synthetase
MPHTSNMSTQAYEEDLARRLGVSQVIAFAYARHALIAILQAAGLQAGDEVILPPLTCKVVALAILSLGLRPVYADIEAATLNLDPECVASAMTSATRAVLFQHTYGNPAGAGAVAAVSAKRSVLFVEDCAQSLPIASVDSAPGRLGRAAIFSNNLLKPLPAGSGGIAATNDVELAARVRGARDRYPRRSAAAEAIECLEAWAHRRILRPALYWPLFDLSRRFTATYRVQPLAAEIANEITGRAFRISRRQARQGSRWLTRLGLVAAHRRAACAAYAESLRSVDGIVMPCVDGKLPLYYFPVLVERKDDLLQAARRQRLAIVPWPMRTPIYPVEDEGALPAYGYRPGSCPVAESVARRLVGLPTDPSADAAHRAAVVRLVRMHHGVSAHA